MESKTYHWHFLLTTGLVLLLVFIFFIVATKPQAKVTIKTPVTAEISTPTITIIDPYIGAKEPNVTIVEFADFTCDSCAALAPTLASLLNKYPDDVKIVWKDFPNESRSPEATPSAIAARCAADQGMFWQFHDELFLRQNQLNTETYTAIATALGLDMPTFTACTTTSEPLPRVRKAYEEGLALRITATPTLYVNGERYTGSVDFNDLEALVKSARALNN